MNGTEISIWPLKFELEWERELEYDFVANMNFIHIVTYLVPVDAKPIPKTRALVVPRIFGPPVPLTVPKGWHQSITKIGVLLRHHSGNSKCTPHSNKITLQKIPPNP